ncbi:MAG: nucleotidyltransferase domain-containing protein [Kyrpidia sp.]|nr:nucleotidyltransferase domain-containing protein [Kyrpidia sp.]
MDRSSVLDQVRRMAVEHVSGTDIQVYLFGSWARGEERKTSDIDIGLWSKSPLPPETVMSLREKFEESSIPYRVDVVDLTKVDREFLDTIRQEGIEWTGFTPACEPPCGH